GLVARSVESFAAQIIHLAHDADLRRRLGQAGQQYARQFDWDHLAQCYERDVFAAYLPSPQGRGDRAVE
ncbi:MAG: hypothetical protein AB1649_31990, partial [Chloroflexota bacterium]